MILPKNWGSVFGSLHLNCLKFVRNFHEFEKIGFSKIRFFGFQCFELDVALSKLVFVGANTRADFKI